MIKIRRLEFTYATISLKIEDNSLYEKVCYLFPSTDGRQMPKASRHHIEITIYGDGFDEKYHVVRDECHVFQCIGVEAALYYIIATCGEIICEKADEMTYIMHAASIMIEGKLVLLIGSSGAGKTTLSLLLAKYGDYIGDEYAYLNSNDGSVWHEQQPIQIKEGNDIILGNKTYECVRGYSDEIGFVYFIPVSRIETHRIIDERDRIKPSFLVFPIYKRGLECTQITRVDYSKLPLLVLQSLLGKELPSYVFKKFIHLVNTEKIRLLKIEFSDGRDASQKLKDLAKGDQSYEIQTV